MHFEADIIAEIVFSELDYCKYTQNATANNLKFHNVFAFLAYLHFFVYFLYSVHSHFEHVPDNPIW